MKRFHFRCKDVLEREERLKASKARWRENNRAWCRETEKARYHRNKDCALLNGEKRAGGKRGKGETVQGDLQVLAQGGYQGEGQEKVLGVEAEEISACAVEG